MCKPQMPSETQLMGNEVPIWKIFVDLLTSVLIQGATIADLSVSITPVDNYQLPHGALPPSPVNHMALIIHVYIFCFVLYAVVFDLLSYSTDANRVAFRYSFKL